MDFKRTVTPTLLVFLALRAFFLVLFVYTLDQVLDLGTRPSVISGAIVVGIIIGALLTRTKLKTRGLLVGTVLAILGYLLIFRFLNAVTPLPGDSAFSIELLRTHLDLIAAGLLIGALTTWFFFTFRHAVTVEVIFLSAVCVTLLSGHRNYHLDTPQVINNFAWSLGVAPQSMLVLCGASTILSLLLYSLVSNRGLKGSAKTEKSNLLLTVLGFSLLTIIIAGVGRYVLSSYDITKGLVTNGVGEATKEGSTPLGFHSALGSTNQPSALVRLEGDYSANPFSPMLYMRESALSKYNGHELVIAGGNLDRDVPNTHPLEPFLGVQDKELTDRVEVVQSIYLLSDQKNSFAIDYPISIKQLKNPDQKRFRSAFRSYSLAPTYKLDDIKFDSIGDPRWSDEVRKHYLEAHPDPRYQSLALRVTEDVASPIEKAFAITEFLSAKSIYTLTPNHDVKADQDPVAPYLFGDMRGYCVHFAHSMVYMFRALGIPARIGTGYLTDLSQSRDGHILLRMSDRHAWAEVYIERLGWVPFDIEPEQVESAAETTVDMNLLEELMGSLEPGEELLPKDALEGEANIYPDSEFYIPGWKDLLVALASFVLLLFLSKLYLRFGWVLPGSPVRTLLRSQRAVVSTLADLGVERAPGETIREFSDRLQTESAVDLSIGNLVARVKYAQNVRVTHSEIARFRTAGLRSVKKFPTWRRLLGFFNPKSIIPEIRVDKR